MKGKTPPDSPTSTEEHDPDLKHEEIDLPAKIEEDAEFQQFVKSAPSPMRGVLMQIMRMQGGRAPSHPIFDKFTPEHVGKFLDYSHDDDVHEYTLARENRWFYLAYVVLAVGFLVFLIVFLTPSHKDLLTDILRLLLAFAGGFGAGFGLKSYLEKRR